MISTPIFYSFRRCPFAIRARLALLSSQTRVELREVKLSDMPEAMLRISPKATVPVLQQADGEVIEESLDVMRWCLAQSDPQTWLAQSDAAIALIERIDTEFKPLLDRYKYADRFTEMTLAQHREAAEVYLLELDRLLVRQPYLGGDRFGLADAAILPFIRQFVGVDSGWFEQSRYQALRGWLEQMLRSDFFARVMHKYPIWKAEDEPVYFGDEA